MGYDFKLKKLERDQLMREICKSELLDSNAPSLFDVTTSSYVVTYSVKVRHAHLNIARPGLMGLLIADEERVVLWAESCTVGVVCKEDASEIAALLSRLPGETDTCLASVVSEVDAFGVCKVQITLQEGGQ